MRRVRQNHRELELRLGASISVHRLSSQGIRRPPRNAPRDSNHRFEVRLALIRPGWQEAVPDLSHLAAVEARRIPVAEIWRPSAFRTFFETPKGQSRSYALRVFSFPTASRSGWGANGRNCVAKKNRADFLQVLEFDHTRMSRNGVNSDVRQEGPRSEERGAQIETYGSHDERCGEPEATKQGNQRKRVGIGLSLRSFAR
jgi:hypothetical protein